jgi:hypothetical protein
MLLGLFGVALILILAASASGRSAGPLRIWRSGVRLFESRQRSGGGIGADLSRRMVDLEKPVRRGGCGCVGTTNGQGVSSDQERHRRMDATTARSQDQPACLGDPANDRNHLGVFADDRRLTHALTCFEFDLKPNTNASMQDLAWDPWTWEVFCGQFTGGTIYPPRKTAVLTCCAPPDDANQCKEISVMKLLDARHGHVIGFQRRKSELWLWQNWTPEPGLLRRAASVRPSSNMTRRLTDRSGGEWAG